MAVVASLPCYLDENVDRQRGKGVFGASIEGLRRLNALGYGGEDPRPVPRPRLRIPRGPVLPPAQGELERAYKEALGRRYGVHFNRLLTLANMPIGRFGSTLISKGQFEGYLKVLRAAHVDANVEHVMCRNTVSIDWQGYAYDCDFNQMLGLPMRLNGSPRTHLADLLGADFEGTAHRHPRPLLRLHRGAGEQLRRSAELIRHAGGTSWRSAPAAGDLGRRPPCWTRPRALARSLHPLQSVRGRDVEVIVVDGGSRDGTPRAAHPPVRPSSSTPRAAAPAR